MYYNFFELNVFSFSFFLFLKLIENERNLPRWLIVSPLFMLAEKERTKNKQKKREEIKEKRKKEKRKISVYN